MKITSPIDTLEQRLLLVTSYTWIGGGSDNLVTATANWQGGNNGGLVDIEAQYQFSNSAPNIQAVIPDDTTMKGFYIVPSSTDFSITSLGSGNIKFFPPVGTPPAYNDIGGWAGIWYSSGDSNLSFAVTAPISMQSASGTSLFLSPYNNYNPNALIITGLISGSDLTVLVDKSNDNSSGATVLTNQSNSFIKFYANSPTTLSNPTGNLDIKVFPSNLDSVAGRGEIIAASALTFSAADHIAVVRDLTVAQTETVRGSWVEATHSYGQLIFTPSPTSGRIQLLGDIYIGTTAASPVVSFNTAAGIVSPILGDIQFGNTTADAGTPQLPAQGLISLSTTNTASSSDFGQFNLQGTISSLMTTVPAVEINAQTNLLLNADNLFQNSTTLQLNNGGKLSTNGHGASIGSLTLSGGGLIDFAGGDSVLSFGDSSSQVWTGSLIVKNWDGNVEGGGNDQLIFQSILPSQLTSVAFDITLASHPALVPARQLPSGEVVPASSYSLTCGTNSMTVQAVALGNGQIAFDWNLFYSGQLVQSGQTTGVPITACNLTPQQQAQYTNYLNSKMAGWN